MIGLGSLILTALVASGPSAPTYSSLSVSVGDISGGYPCVLTGTNLSSASLTFGGTSATITGNTATTITFTVPAHATGLVGLTVTTAGGSVSPTNVFRYFSPAELTLGLWERTPYSSAGAWAGSASLGTSGTPSFSSGAQPSNGAAINTRVPASFNGTTQFLDSTSLVSDAVTAHAGTLAFLMKAASAAAPVANPYSEPAIISDNNAIIGVGFNSSGARAYFQDSISGLYNSITVACSTAAWHLVQMRWDGTTFGLRIDGGAWSNIAAADVQNVSGSLRLGRNYLSVFLGLDIAEVIGAKSALADATLDDIRAYANTRYAGSVTV